jgi:DNA-binding transcriptional LysR family regulator
MRLRGIDLNLLVVFHALAAERSVSRAAQRLGLTQSAVSHALRRLRATFEDDLFVRGEGGLAPTPRALAAMESVRTALDEIERCIVNRPTFDPLEAQRSFTLRVTEYLSSEIVQRLCLLLRKEAPGLRLRVLQFDTRSRTDGIVGDDLHVSIDTGAPIPEGIHRLRLLDESFVVLFRRKGASARARMSVAHYAGLPHVKVVATIGTNVIDDALARRGLTRNIIHQVSSWRDARFLVARSDLVATLPARFARSGAEADVCATAPCPLPGIGFAVDLMWSARYEDDPAHRWLRGKIAEALLATGPHEASSS